MTFEETPLAGLLVVTPNVFKDNRGYFKEVYTEKNYLPYRIGPFVQQNHSHSHKGVMRGLHYQIKHPQGKFVQVTSGSIWDVAVDLRRPSPTFGKWFGLELSETNHKMFWIPPGFAHGFITLTDSVDVLYSVTDYRYAEHERTIAWNDPDLNISWNVPVLDISTKDKEASLFKDAEIYG